mgnify:FL=1|jgi:hypothetical protein
MKTIEEETNLPILEPTAQENYLIKQLGDLHPQLDYQMLLVLVKSSKEDIDKIQKELQENPQAFKPTSFEVIKGGMEIN